jgi:cardiolipin synthase
VDFDTDGRYPDLRLMSDSPTRQSIVFSCHVERFRHARRRIWIANSYFFPPVSMLQALVDAAQRGVDVRVLVPGQSDLWLLAGAARAEYLDWLAGGLQIWEYEPTVMHAKYALVDEDWCTVGSFNANATSLLWAIELNLFMSTPELVALLAARFEEDLGCSRRISPDQVRGRPLLQRELDHVARLVMGLTDVALAPRED